jgi:Mn-dependent DtxR family transcriptional regulator
LVLQKEFVFLTVGRQAGGMPRRPSLEVTVNGEDYLERIHELIEEKGYARVSDIAVALRLTRSTVTAMVQRLSRMGYLQYEKYRGLTLTPKGQEVALRIQQRHETLLRFLTLLKVDVKTAAEDIEGLEHCLSARTLKKLEQLVRAWTKNPALLQQALKG